jgi:RHS repeat-associated protein
VSHNPFRFSTKFADAESGLLYYGYRYLNTSTGRWLNRDPMGESGGYHLSAFVATSPTLGYDALGLQVFQGKGAAIISYLTTVSVAQGAQAYIDYISTASVRAHMGEE